MENIKKLLCETLNIDFIQAILSNPRTKEGIIKVKVRPVMMKDRLFLQLESFSKTQAFHENLEPEAAVERIVDYMKEFKQMQMATKDTDYTILVSKKGKVTIQKKAVKTSRNSKQKIYFTGRYEGTIFTGSWGYDTRWQDCENTI